MSRTPACLLNRTIENYLPRAAARKAHDHKMALRPGHHLVYFPQFTSLPEGELLLDGTDPLQSPGEPFNRRMWAGGRMKFQSDKDLIFATMPTLRCHERISDVTVKGLPGNEKAFVNIERRIEAAGRENASLSETGIIIEDRSIVFMRENFAKKTKGLNEVVNKILKPSHEPTYSHEIIPSPTLLFRFSALTFNAHRIHLDKQYCFDIEGHRNLLVHGPLSLILILEVLQHHLTYEEGYRNACKAIKEIEYRNLAPLYAEEMMRICGRKNGEGKYEVWIEGKYGGLAVKGVVTVGSPDE
ncbi:MAG: hypothetical protein MMC33_001132 [Icmadophila ericetorum]|nr:hypothetical protein [Icmadophila ericetorum]